MSADSKYPAIAVLALVGLYLASSIAVHCGIAEPRPIPEPVATLEPEPEPEPEAVEPVVPTTVAYTLEVDGREQDIVPSDVIELPDGSEATLTPTARWTATTTAYHFEQPSSVETIHGPTRTSTTVFVDDTHLRFEVVDCHGHPELFNRFFDELKLADFTKTDERVTRMIGRVEVKGHRWENDDDELFDTYVSKLGKRCVWVGFRHATDVDPDAIEVILSTLAAGPAREAPRFEMQIDDDKPVPLAVDAPLMVHGSRVVLRRRSMTKRVFDGLELEHAPGMVLAKTTGLIRLASLQGDLLVLELYPDDELKDLFGDQPTSPVTLDLGTEQLHGLAASDGGQTIGYELRRGSRRLAVLLVTDPDARAELLARVQPILASITLAR